VLFLLVSIAFIIPIFAGVLAVPFAKQAPFSNWAEPWQNACEETSIVMVQNFYSNGQLDKFKAKKEILTILNLKNKFFGTSKDENAAQIVEIINNFLPWEARVVSLPSLEQIKNEINNKRPVILPVHGKALKNSYFLNGGSDYHMLVISGYDDGKQEFVTMEPGIGVGEKYRYSYETLINAMHDFVPNKKTKTGAKVAIFTSPVLEISADLDIDQDGLSKRLEFFYKTNTALADTDADGYLDGAEVQAGYLPLLAEEKLKNGSLLKITSSEKVYLLDHKTKRHIHNMQAFVNHGWQSADIQTVSEQFLNNLPDGVGIVE